jgi:uncharacterized membrane protein affecting hemolysin expression
MLFRLKSYLAFLGALVPLFAALIFNNKRIAKNAKREGQEQAEEIARRLDHENAAAIRDRARAARSVQPKADDTRGYRD